MSGAARFLAERIGLRVDGATGLRLQRVVREAARRASCPEASLGRLLAGDPLRAQELIDQVTVQESAFFRHPEHFDLLAAHLRSLPQPSVIWSAGCGNGQEAWSLAMLLEEQGLLGWTVLGTDVSVSALRRAQEGEYEPRELRGLSAPRRSRFLDAGAIAPRLRGRVRFLHHNVAAAAPPPEAGDCRVVLCRNVLIYLHRAAIDRFLGALRLRMPQDGLLLIGTSEALGRLDGFRRGPLAGTFVHGGAARAERVERGAPAEQPPPLSRLLADGNRLAAAGDLDGAAVCFRRAGFLDPQDPRPPERLRAVLEEIARRP